MVRRILRRITYKALSSTSNFFSLAHYLLLSMSSEKTIRYRSSLRVSYCFATSLSFVTIVAITCIALILRLHPGRESSNTMDPSLTGVNRTVRLIAHSLITTTHSYRRSFSVLPWSQPIFLKLIWLWIGMSWMIPA